jgi:hypothetical protein
MVYLTPSSAKNFKGMGLVQGSSTNEVTNYEKGAHNRSESANTGPANNINPKKGMLSYQQDDNYMCAYLFLSEKYPANRKKDNTARQILIHSQQ